MSVVSLERQEMNFVRKFLLRKKRVHIFLIKPSNYDDDGYVVTHFRGVLPSNTLSCLAALTKDVIERRMLADGVKVPSTF